MKEDDESKSKENTNAHKRKLRNESWDSMMSRRGMRGNAKDVLKMLAHFHAKSMQWQ